MSTNAEKLLRLTADMERFMHTDDKLGQMVEMACDNELFEDDLLFVAAAASVPSYEGFMRQMNARNQGFEV